MSDTDCPGLIYAGLDRLLILNYPPASTPKSLSSDEMRAMERIIASGLVRRAGPLDRAEIRFLREALELTPDELADRVDLSADLLRLAETEHGSYQLEYRTEAELRRLAITHFDFATLRIEDLYRTISGPVTDDGIIRIDVRGEDHHWVLADQ